MRHIVVGDSIANRFLGHYRKSLTNPMDITTVGIGTQTVLNRIKGNSKAFAGNTVILSTGWTNTPTPKDKVAKEIKEQVELLKQYGAKHIYIFGVANDYKHSSPSIMKVVEKEYPNKDYNAFLKTIAPTVGGFDSDKKDGMHPAVDSQLFKDMFQLATQKTAEEAANAPVATDNVPYWGEGAPSKKLSNSIEQNLDIALRLPALLVERAEYIKKKEEYPDTKYNFTYSVETMINGAAMALEMSRSLDYPSLAFLGEDKYIESENLISTLNENWINSFTGYSYADLGFEKVTKDPWSLQHANPTYFLQQGFITEAVSVQNVISLANELKKDDFSTKQSATRSVLDSSINSEALSEASNHGMGRMVGDIEETRYIVEEQLTKDVLKPKYDLSTPTSGDVGGADGPTGDGTISTYTGEWNATLARKLGKLQDSSKASIGEGYNKYERAFLDLVSRAEGTHEALGAKGWTQGVKGSIARSPGDKNGPKGGAFPNFKVGDKHPGKAGGGETGSAWLGSYWSDALGRYQFTYDTWVGAGGNRPMTVKEQDKSALALLNNTSRAFVAKGDFDGLYTVLTRVEGNMVAQVAGRWASFPRTKTDSRGAYGDQGGKFSFAELKEAYNHLVKYYENATAINTGNSPSLAPVDPTAKTQGKADEIANPKELNLQTKPIELTMPMPDRDYMNTMKVGVRYGPAEFVAAVNARTYILKMKSDSTPVMVTLRGFRPPLGDVKIDFYEKYSGSWDKLWSAITFNRIDSTHKKTTVRFGNSEWYGHEARSAAAHILKHDVSNIHFTVKKAPTEVKGIPVVEVDLDWVNDGQHWKDFSAALIRKGLGKPTNDVGTKYDAVLSNAKAANRGLWAYRGSVLRPDGSYKQHAYKEDSLKDLSNSVASPYQGAAAQSHIPTTPYGNTLTISNTNAAKIEEGYRKLEKSGKLPEAFVDTARANTPKSKMETRVVSDKAALGASSNLIHPDAMSSPAAKAAAYAMKHKLARSASDCAYYVRRALGIGGGYKIFNSPAGHAYQYFDVMSKKQSDFVQVDISSPYQIGDVIVIHKNPSSEDYGHVQIYAGNGTWVSDFSTPRAYCYPKGPWPGKEYYSLWRDKNYIAPGVKLISPNKRQAWAEPSGIPQTNPTISGETTAGDVVAYQNKVLEIGLKPDLSAYTDEQIQGFSYGIVETDNISVFSKTIRDDKHATYLAKPFENRLNTLFPVVKAYTVVGNEDDEPYVHGIPLRPSLYYELPPIQNFHLETNNDYNPLDVCTFSVINPSSTRSLVDQHSDIGLKQNELEVNTQFFYPQLAQKLKLQAGMRIHIRAGYSANPNELTPIFNGVIKETSGTMDRVIECVCESYAAELLAQQMGANEPTDLSGNHNASTGLLLAYAMLNDNINHFGAQLGRYQTFKAWMSSLDVVSPFRIYNAFADSTENKDGLVWNEHFAGFLGLTEFLQTKPRNDEVLTYYSESQSLFTGLILGGKGREGDFRDPENKALVAPISSGQFLWHIFNISRGNLSQRLYSNIYSDAIEKAHGVFKDNAWERWSSLLDWDRKVFYKFYVYKSTAWDVIKEMEYRHPGTLAKPMIYEDRQSMFYGIKDQLYIARDLDPIYMMRAGFQGRHGEITKPYSKTYLQERVKRMEPVSKYHFISSSFNMISNGLVLNRDFGTKATAVYFENKWFGFAESTYKKSETIALAETTAKFDIKESTVELGGCHGSYMAYMYATNELKKQMELMYGGTITLVGNPDIKAGDFAYICDHDRGVSGTVKIREASHHFSSTHGYITKITPSLFVECTHFFWDDYMTKMHLAGTILNSVITMKQDFHQTGSERFQSYNTLLDTYANFKEMGVQDYIYAFGGYALLGGALFLTFRSLKLWGRLTGAVNMLKYLGTANSYVRAISSASWKAASNFASRQGARIAAAHTRVVQSVAKQSPTHWKHLFTLNRKRMRTWNLVKQFFGKGGKLTKGAWGVARKLGGWVAGRALGFVFANPVSAIVGATIAIVGGMFIAWAMGRVRRSQLSHNAITFFPLDHGGEPYVAGISGFTNLGEMESAWYNLKKNAKALAKAGRILAETGMHSDGTKTSTAVVGATLDSVFSDIDFIIESVDGNK